MKPRLSRLDRIYTRHLFYFLTLNTHQRKPLLANPKIHDSFRRFCIKATEHGVFVGRYVIMPDHIHLFAAFDGNQQSQSLSIWMKSLKNSLSKSLRGLGIEAPHWQRNFFDHLMRDEESYGAKWDYIERNPQRKNLLVSNGIWPHQGEIHHLTFS